MKKVIVILITLILIIAGTAYWALNSATFTELVLPPVANYFVKDIRITKLTVAQQTFSLKGAFTVDSLLIKIKDQTGEIALAFDKVQIASVYDLLRIGRLVSINASGGTFMATDLVIDAIQFHGAAAHTSDNKYTLNGDVSIAKVDAQKLIVTNMTGHLEGVLPEITISNIMAQCYNGSLNVAVIAKPEEKGYLEISLTLDNIDIYEAGKDRPDLFNQVNGIADISALVKANTGGITDVQAEMVMVEKSKVNASLLQYLLNYIPPSAERTELELSIKEKKKITVDKAAVKVTDFDSEKISLLVQLSSKRINLDLNLTLDLIVEGGLMKLFMLTDKK